MANSFSTSSTIPLFGQADPTLSINAYGIAPYSENHPLLDVSKQMSSWDSSSGNVDWMIANGHVSASTSWITSTILPGDFWKAITPNNADIFFNEKQYRMQWAGAGTMTAPVEAVIDSSSANEIVFTLGDVNDGLFQVRAISGPISDLTIVDTTHTARYDAGERIDPAYAALIADVRQIRFMDWNQTNASEQTTWASRPMVGQNSYSSDGNGDDLINKAAVPIELMVELCNRVKADMYFTFPHAANDNYIIQAATYVRDNLNSELTCTFEISNEVWNFGFTVQQAYFLDLGNALWPDAVGVEDPQQIRLSALGYRTYQAAQLIDAVYVGQLGRRAIALSVHGGYSFMGIVTLDASIWKTYRANNTSTSGPYVAPHTAITHLAITSYFGVGALAESRQAAIEAAYPATSDALIESYLRSTGKEGGDVSSIEASIIGWDTYNTIAADRGIKMVLYEGGPHMVFATGTQSQTARDACRQWLASPLGAAFCTDMQIAWAANSEAAGPFMQFQDVGAWSVFGHWTIWETMNSAPVGYMAQLLTLNASTRNWWGGTTDYRHGVI